MAQQHSGRIMNYCGLKKNDFCALFNPYFLVSFGLSSYSGDLWNIV